MTTKWRKGEKVKEHKTKNKWRRNEKNGWEETLKGHEIRKQF